MSSHHVYVRCPAEGCTTPLGSLYTGDLELDDYSDSQWEGEFITAWCKEHES